jgi:hypothetical protein
VKLETAAVLSCCLLGPALAGAEDAGTWFANGKFASGTISFEVSDAYAFRSKSSFGEDQVIQVMVTNSGIREEAIHPWLDRKKVFDKRFQDEETATIYFEFSPKGEYQAISYYLGSGNGCGYCSGGDVKSTVKLVGGKLAGAFSFQGKDRSWDITLDVPVAPDDHGAALPAGGGEPGKAYLAFAAAVKGRDAAALKKLLIARRLAGLEKAEKDGEIQDFLSYLDEGRYADTVKVEKGFATADTAILLVSGDGPIGKRAGQALVRKEAAGWRVDDEILESGPE